MTILHKYSDGLLDNFKKQYYVPQNLQKMALLCALHSADTNIKPSEKSPIAELTPLRMQRKSPLCVLLYHDHICISIDLQYFICTLYINFENSNFSTYKRKYCAYRFFVFLVYIRQKCRRAST